MPGQYDGNLQHIGDFLKKHLFIKIISIVKEPHC